MSEPPLFDGGLDREITEPERTDLALLADWLFDSRPYPPFGLRDRVRSVMPRRDPIARPRRLWLRVAVLATAGAVLLLVVAAGLVGSGPLAV
jgi:hypothetical protein